jgi:hypothetical protein
MSSGWRRAKVADHPQSASRTQTGKTRETGTTAAETKKMAARGRPFRLQGNADQKACLTPNSKPLELWPTDSVGPVAGVPATRKLVPLLLIDE